MDTEYDAVLLKEGNTLVEQASVVVAEAEGEPEGDGFGVKDVEELRDIVTDIEGVGVSVPVEVSVTELVAVVVTELVAVVVPVMESVHVTVAEGEPVSDADQEGVAEIDVDGVGDGDGDRDGDESCRAYTSPSWDSMYTTPSSPIDGEEWIMLRVANVHNTVPVEPFTAWSL
jgi:hypothetical protein